MLPAENVRWKHPERALHNRRALMRAPPEPADTSSLYFILFSAALWWTFIVGPFNPRWLF